MNRKAEDFLMDIGMPVSIKGFTYAAEATEMLARKGRKGRCSVCQLYAELAKTCGSTPNQIDRVIRYAVEKMMENNCAKAVEARERVFRNTIKGQKSRIENFCGRWHGTYGAKKSRKTKRSDNQISSLKERAGRAVFVPLNCSNDMHP